MLDIFNNDAFGVTTLTDTINKIKSVPGRIGAMGLFQASGIATTTIAIEERNGVLTLVSPTPRGGPGQTVEKMSRSARALVVPHFEVNDSVMAEEVQGVRAFGTESQVETVQGLVADRLQIHSQSFSATQEFARVGAVKGIVTYADSSTLNLFTVMGVSALSDLYLDLEDADPTLGALREALAVAARGVARSLDGLPFTGLYAFCGDNFFDKLIRHPEVRQSYLAYTAAAELRQGYVDFNSALSGSFGSFPFGGVMWENYRGKVGATDFIDADTAHIFPLGVPGLFRTYYAPADYEETVNTIGQRLYSKQYPMPNGKGRNLDTQMNALEICTRPSALLKAHVAAS